MANKIQIKRGNIANLPSFLDAGEFGLAIDSQQVFIGDGTTNIELATVNGNNSIWNIFDANTILAANTDNTPTARTIAEQEVIGRLTGGNIGGITIGIGDNNILQVDGAPNDNEFARFTANGIEGLTGAETMAALSGQATANFDMNGYKITGCATPTLDDDYAIKSYVDALSAGIGAKFVADVRAQGNVATLSGLQTIDGVILTDGEQILLDQQTTPSQDGLYVVRTGTWERATGWEVGAEVGAYYVFIKGGTDDGNGYICTNDDGSDVVGTNDLVFVQFSQAGGGANKQLSNLEDTVAINKSLLPGTTDVISLGSATKRYNNAYFKSGGAINFGNGDVSILHQAGQLLFQGGDIDLVFTGYAGRDADNNLDWSTDDSLGITIGGVTRNITSISTGVGDNDKLVTQGYVDDAITSNDSFDELNDTPASKVAYGIVRANATGTALEYITTIDGGAF